MEEELDIKKVIDLPKNNLNDEAEAFKSLAYAMKDQYEHKDRNVNAKLLRALRSHEKRLVRLENIFQVIIKQKDKEACE